MPKKGFLEKVATISRPEYLQLDSELMDQIGTTEKECQRFIMKAVKIERDDTTLAIKKQ